jgi:hypothetical protein
MPAFRKNFRIIVGSQINFLTGGYLKAGTSFMKKVTRWNFIKASKNLIFNFLHKNASKYFENHQRFYKIDLI